MRHENNDMSEADANGDIDRLLGDALDLEPADRERMLQRIGASDGPLRDRLSKLIALAAQDGGFLSRSPLCDAASSDQPEEDSEPAAAGTPVGPYRIVREIGRGGMGTVYLAERTDGQFQRHVAVKLITRGMDTARRPPPVSRRAPDSGRSGASEHRAAPRRRDDR